LHPDTAPIQSWVEQCLAPTTGPIIAVSDYLRAVPDLIRTWVPRRYVALGTDGYGRSDTRAALRRFFEVDRRHIAVAALQALADEGKLDRSQVIQAMTRYDIAPDQPNPWDR
jgi:pyruvate dehydrogenase E1 component